MKKKKTKVSMSDKTFKMVITVIATIVLALVLYPMVYVVSSSFSTERAIFAGQVYLWPVDFSTFGYEWAISRKLIWIGYENSIRYTVGATVLHLFMTICGAYPLSRKNYQAKGFITKCLVASMLLGGGLIPLFILVNGLGLYNNPLWIFISGIVSINHIMILRIYFQKNIPYELFESARMDGISDYGYLIKIVLPLSRVAIAVICLFAAVETWNSYITPLLYLRDRDYYPLQLVLNEMFAEVKYGVCTDGACMIYRPEGMETVRYAMIVIGAAPMLILCLLVQRFFVKGVTMGVVKG